MKKIQAQGLQVAMFSQNEDDYISLTDIAKYKDKERMEYLIQNWIRNRNTIEFLGIWESINNPNFKHIEFDVFKNLAGSNSFSLTPKRWIEGVNAFGIINKSGRYGGGTFAHKDIAFEFASWISPEFKLYLIKEFQRLKTEENKRSLLDWDAKRMLTKINYKIHTDAIKEKIILPKKLSGQDIVITYASEADILNKALFNLTAKEWQSINQDKEGNIRDYADVCQLVVLANLENLNAEYIKEGYLQKDRLLKLNNSAISQMKSLLGNISVRRIDKII
ncbi:MAG: KilA-N domain-containing protein [Patescibacteria group bacterium]